MPWLRPGMVLLQRSSCRWNTFSMGYSWCATTSNTLCQRQMSENFSSECPACCLLGLPLLQQLGNTFCLGRSNPPGFLQCGQLIQASFFYLVMVECFNFCLDPKCMLWSCCCWDVMVYGSPNKFTYVNSFLGAIFLLSWFLPENSFWDVLGLELF